LKEWLVGDITLRSYGTDKYGRVLGDVFCDQGNVADLLKKADLAVDYDGGKKTKVWGE
jgi:endonuclease YncB( thermonuclease family)